MACASSMQKKEGFVIILFVLSLKQTMTIKEDIYKPTTLIQELYTRPRAVSPNDGGDYVVVIPNSPKRRKKGKKQERRAIIQCIKGINS